jgi:hypothetical protein
MIPALPYPWFIVERKHPETSEFLALGPEEPTNASVLARESR